MIDNLGETEGNIFNSLTFDLVAKNFGRAFEPLLRHKEEFTSNSKLIQLCINFNEEFGKINKSKVNEIKKKKLIADLKDKFLNKLNEVTVHKDNVLSKVEIPNKKLQPKVIPRKFPWSNNEEDQNNKKNPFPIKIKNPENPLPDQGLPKLNIKKSNLTKSHLGVVRPKTRKVFPDQNNNPTLQQTGKFYQPGESNSSFPSFLTFGLGNTNKFEPINEENSLASYKKKELGNNFIKPINKNHRNLNR